MSGEDGKWYTRNEWGILNSYTRNEWRNGLKDMTTCKFEDKIKDMGPVKPGNTLEKSVKNLKTTTRNECEKLYSKRVLKT